MRKRTRHRTTIITYQRQTIRCAVREEAKFAPTIHGHYASHLHSRQHITSHAGAVLLNAHRFVSFGCSARSAFASADSDTRSNSARTAADRFVKL
jgi:hypothetical protein